MRNFIAALIAVASLAATSQTFAQADNPGAGKRPHVVAEGDSLLVQPLAMAALNLDAVKSTKRQ